MLRATAVGGLAATLVIAAASFAIAESQTVKGTGAIEKMVAENGQRKVTAEVSKLPKPCDGTRWTRSLQVRIDWKGPDFYRAEGSCIGEAWYRSLAYYEDADDSEPRIVDCADFALTRNADTQTFRVVAPRKCLRKANDKVRLYAEAVTTTTAAVSVAGPTRLLSRG